MEIRIEIDIGFGYEITIYVGIWMILGLEL